MKTLQNAKILGFRIEPRFSIDGGRTWKHGGWHTVRNTWFGPDELELAKQTADAIVKSLRDSEKLAVVINEQDEAAGLGCIEYSAQFENEN